MKLKDVRPAQVLDSVNDRLTIVVAPYSQKAEQVLPVYRESLEIPAGAFCYEEKSVRFMHIHEFQLAFLSDISASFQEERIKKGLSVAQNHLRNYVKRREDFPFCDGIKRNYVNWENVGERLLLLSLTLFNYTDNAEFAIRVVRRYPHHHTIETLASGLREYSSAVKGIEIRKKDAVDFVFDELVTKSRQLKTEPFPCGGGRVEARLAIA